MGAQRQSPPSPELKVFGNRLAKAAELKKIDISVLAKELNCAPADIKKMMSGMRELTMTKMMRVSNILGCSVDYLLGLTPEAKRASLVVTADTGLLKPESSEPVQTSGRIPGKFGQFMMMVSGLLETDIDLLMYIAGFLIERKEKGLLRLAKAINEGAKEDTKESRSVRVSAGKSKVSDSDEESDDDFEDDDLFDGVEDEDDGGYEDDDIFDDEDDFDDEDFD
jgi:transcriptional regulator with XRE-family HTH domain